MTEFISTYPGNSIVKRSFTESEIGNPKEVLCCDAVDHQVITLDKRDTRDIDTERKTTVVETKDDLVETNDMVLTPERSNVSEILVDIDDKKDETENVLEAKDRKEW